MRKSIRGTAPDVDGSAFVSEQAYLVGDVTVEERASVWPFVCLRGDGGAVEIGAESNVQEFSMLHGVTIGEGVTVGHAVTIDYATIEDASLVGINSVVLDGATVESDCIVAAGSVVLPDQTIPEGHMAYGIPAETKPLTDDQRDQIARVHEHYVELGREYKAEGGFE